MEKKQTGITTNGLKHKTSSTRRMHTLSLKGDHSTGYQNKHNTDGKHWIIEGRVPISSLTYFRLVRLKTHFAAGRQKSTSHSNPLFNGEKVCARREMGTRQSVVEWICNRVVHTVCTRLQVRPNGALWSAGWWRLWISNWLTRSAKITYCRKIRSKRVKSVQNAQKNDRLQQGQTKKQRFSATAHCGVVKEVVLISRNSNYSTPLLAYRRTPQGARFCERR